MSQYVGFDVERFEYFQFLNREIAEVIYIPQDKNDTLDTETELFAKARIDEDSSCSGCGCGIKPNETRYTLLSQPQRAQVDQFMRHHINSHSSVSVLVGEFSKLAKAYHRLKTGKCDDKACTDAEQLKDSKTLIEQSYTPNARASSHFVVDQILAGAIKPTLAPEIVDSLEQYFQWEELIRLAHFFIQKDYVNMMWWSGKVLAEGTFKRDDWGDNYAQLFSAIDQITPPENAEDVRQGCIDYLLMKFSQKENLVSAIEQSTADFTKGKTARDVLKSLKDQLEALKAKAEAAGVAVTAPPPPPPVAATPRTTLLSSLPNKKVTPKTIKGASKTPKAAPSSPVPAVVVAPPAPAVASMPTTPTPAAPPPPAAPPKDPWEAFDNKFLELKRQGKGRIQN